MLAIARRIYLTFTHGKGTFLLLNNRVDHHRDIWLLFLKFRFILKSELNLKDIFSGNYKDILQFQS